MLPRPGGETRGNRSHKRLDSMLANLPHEPYLRPKNGNRNFSVRKGIVFRSVPFWEKG